jgi:multidrug resistance protein, MATE family
MLSMTGGMIMMLVDRLTLAYYSELTLAASGPTIFTLMTFTMFFTGAASISRSFIAQAYGGGKNHRLIGCTGLIYSFFLALVLLALYPLLTYLPTLSDFPEEIILLEKTYFRVGIFYGSLMVINTGFISYFNGLLKTSTVLKISLVGQIINVILTPVFVFGIRPFPELGMIGSALGTLIAEIVMLIAFTSTLYRLGELKRKYFLLKQSDIKAMFHRGIPAGLTACLDEAANTAFIWVVGALGIAALSSLSAVLVINYIMIIPIIGLATGTGTFVATKLGANEFNHVKNYLNAGFTLGIFYVIVTSILVLFFWQPMLKLAAFKADSETFILAKYTMFVLWTYPFAFVFTMIGSSVLHAFGETRFSFIVRALITAIFSIPILWIIVNKAGLSSITLAICWLYGSVIELLIGRIYLRRIKNNIKNKINLIKTVSG